MLRIFSQCGRGGFAVGALCLALSGCGDDRGHVSGDVTLDGQPLLGGVGGVTATITFQPASGNGANGVGLVNPEGRYELTTGTQPGVTPGDYVVSCAASQVIPSTTGGAASGKALIDPKFTSGQTSGLAFKVEPGNNEFNVELTSLKAKSAAAR